MSSSKSSRYAIVGQSITCPICQESRKPRGFKTHYNACSKRQLGEILEEAMNEGVHAHQLGEVECPDDNPAVATGVADIFDDLTSDTGGDFSQPPDMSAPDGTTGSTVPAYIPVLDDIQVEYHPNCERGTHFSHFEDFQRYDRPQACRPPSNRPWRPWRTREDFELSELAFQAALSKEQLTRLLKLIHRCIDGEGTLTLRNCADVEAGRTAAANALTPFDKDTFTIPYKDENHQFNFWSRSLFGWISDLVHEPSLAPLFEWDAQILSKFDGRKFVRFVDEPWTAQRFWDVQSELPPHGKPFGIILYADKTILSSFGTEMGYPIIARCANLPVDIRNGTGIGGGRVVGWLPIVADNQDHKGKSHFVDFKTAVWHESFRTLLKTIGVEMHNGGFWMRCGDSVNRFICPFIYILSADYEEQCVMVLNRGYMGKSACTVCEIPTSKMSDLCSTYPLRTAAKSQLLVTQAKEASTKKAREDILKPAGLRCVDNAFWTLPHSDPHVAVSWDKMHNFGHGLGGKHIWPLLQEHIHALGRDAASTVNFQYAEMPRWRSLNHFSKGALDIVFADAVKFEDLLKTAIYTCQNVLTPADSPAGYALLRCLRHYLCLDMYASLEVHTELTLTAGERQVTHFADAIQDYISVSPPGKNWDFPKMHSIQHMFDDIKAKGATRNYDTKPNESLHGPIKDSYNLRTNFKNVAQQILQADHIAYSTCYIRQQITEYDDYIKELAAKTKPTDNTMEDRSSVLAIESNASTSEDTQSTSDVVKFIIKSRKSPCTLRSLDTGVHDVGSNSFHRFRLKLGEFLSKSGIPLPGNRYLVLNSDKQIIPFEFLQVFYESKVSWTTQVDYVRCSQQFHGRPRHDYVMLQTDESTTFPIAYIQPLDAPPGRSSTAEKELGLLRLRAQPDTNCRFFFVQSIIRGACVAQKFGAVDEDYYIMDVIDTDMFLRMQEIYHTAS